MAGKPKTSDKIPPYVIIPLLLIGMAATFLGVAVLKGLDEGSTVGFSEKIGARWAGNNKFAR